ncbi:MAG TPA: VTC domain-containing protein, partial [Vicinamibacterales bacterium]|nr:VTC domain-containing protein [Vicinamibacterales bacterium]
MERFEIKYCVPHQVADAVLDVARLFLLPEPGLVAGQSQLITSLYLDTPELTFMKWHLEDAPDRFKLRVRAYGPSPWRTVHAEIKQKHAFISRKRRVEIPVGQLDQLLMGADLRFADRYSHADAAVLEEFSWHQLTLHATPALLLQTSRESLRGAMGEATAVTVDRQVVWQPHRLRTLRATGGWRLLPLPQSAGPAS